MSARMMDKWSIVRSLHHHDAGHRAGDQICFTGYNPGPNPDENVYPSVGSIVSKQLGHLNPTMPPYVMIPRMLPGAGSAYLGVAHKPFETQADPAQPGPFKLPNFQLAVGRDAGAGGRPQGAAEGLRHACAATRTTPGQLDAADKFQREGVGNPHLAGGPRRVRPRQGADEAPRAVRLHAGVRPEGRRTAAGRRTGRSG